MKINNDWFTCPECKSREISWKMVDRKLVALECGECNYHDNSHGWENSWFDTRVEENTKKIEAKIKARA